MTGKSARDSTRNQDTRKARGDAGEAFAAEHLASLGDRVLTRNWRPGAGAGRVLRGELDLVTWCAAPLSPHPSDRRTSNAGTLRFVEVKARSDAAAAPQEAVTPAKQRQISRLAEAFVALELPALLPELGCDLPLDEVRCGFDVMEVWLRAGLPIRALLHRDAFDFLG